MDRIFTSEQESAVRAGGRFIIVSAAAGSGKTTVMIEKLIRMLSDCENKVRADRLIVVTFTNDAAAQISRRLCEELSKTILLCENDEEKSWLLTQKTYLSAAKISTISSFCFDLIREHSDAAGITPDFKICSEQESKIYLLRAVEEISDEYFSSEEKNGALTEIYELFGAFSNPSYDKESIFAELLFFRSFLLSIPFYKERFLLPCIEDYKKGLSDVFDPADTLFGKKYIEKAMEILSDEKLIYSADLIYSCWEKALCSPEAFIRDFDQKRPKDHFITSYEYIGALHGFLSEYKNGGSADWDKIISAARPRGDLFRDDLSPKTRISVIKHITAFCGTGAETAEDILEAFDVIIEKCSALRDINPCTEEELRSDYIHHYRLLSALAGFIEDINDRYGEFKREKNILDFSDAETLALSVLGKIENGVIVKTDIAKRLSAQYDMILIDEFQDSNDMQDIIFRLLSPEGDGMHEGKNMFIVGDIKQSIYNFRLANPKLFRSYLKNSERYEDNPDSVSPGNVLLNMNFRSGREVIDFVNLIFGKIMTENSGGIDYDDSQRLIFSGDGWYERNRELINRIGSLETEILLVDKNNAPFFEGSGGESPLLPDGNDDNDIRSDILEAEAVALKINRLLSENRGLKADDICVLCRTNEQTERFAAALGKLGIPAAVNDTGSFLESREISFMTCFLRLIDNPHNNAALAGVIMSPVFMLPADDMALLSAARGKSESYYALLCRIREPDGGSEIFADTSAEKQTEIKSFAEDFLGKFDRIRKLSSACTVENMIRLIIRELSVVEIMSLYPDGDVKRANLLLLPEYAAAYEKNNPAGSGGIYGFIRFIDAVSANRRADFAAGSASSESSGAVAVKTIHKSKGLEYPVVFLCRTTSSSRARMRNVYFTGEDGTAFFVNRKYDRAGYISLPAEMIAAESKKNEKRELMRLMYVAMTRAKCKLFISGTVSLSNNKVKIFHPEGSVETEGKYHNTELDITDCEYMGIFGDDLKKLAASASSDGKINSEILMKSPENMLFPIAAALAASGEVPFFDILGQKREMTVPVRVKALRDDRELFNALSNRKVRSTGEDIFSKAPDGALLERLLEYKKYDEAEEFMSDRERENIPRKLTVTEITKRTARRSDEDIVYPEFLPEKDEFHSAREYDSRLTGAERGTAIHSFFEHAELHELCSAVENNEDDPVGNEAQRLLFEGKLSEAEAAFITENKKIKRRIASFFSSDIWNCFFKNAAKENIFHEIPFMAKISDIFDKNSGKTLDLILKTYYNDNYNDTFVQGIADLIIKTDGGFVLVDFKTNEGRTADELIGMYRTQLLLYKRVFEMIYSLPEGAGKAYIFSLGSDGGITIKIE